MVVALHLLHLREKGIEVVERSVESVVERVVSVESLVEVSNGL